MTPITTAARTTETAATAQVEQLLRDAAFVLKLTRRLKDDILRDATRPNRPAVAVADRSPAALGV